MNSAFEMYSERGTTAGPVLQPASSSQSGPSYDWADAVDIPRPTGTWPATGKRGQVASGETGSEGSASCRGRGRERELSQAGGGRDRAGDWRRTRSAATTHLWQPRNGVWGDAGRLVLAGAGCSAPFREWLAGTWMTHWRAVAASVLASRE